MRKLKVLFYELIMLSPLLVGMLLLVFIWFIDIEYYSTYFYCSTEVACLDCETLLGADSEFCTKCGKSVEDIAGVRTYTHCDYCSGADIYRNATKEYCPTCGHRLTLGETIALSRLGFTNVKDFRKALMLDNVKKLFNSEIFVSIVIIFVSIICTKAVKGYLLHKLRKRIIKEGLDG